MGGERRGNGKYQKKGKKKTKKKRCGKRVSG
jgi:hypothetical protein